MNFMREFERPCKLITDTGRELPLQVETLDLTPDSLPTLTGHLLKLPYELERSKKYLSPIEKVIFNYPATIVIWKDGTKTVVKCQPGDTYDKELGLAMCISKKYLGNKGNFNEIFKKWIPEDKLSTPIKVGTRIKIIDAGYGALGANGKVGTVTNKVSTSGVLEVEPGYNVECDNGYVWRIKPNAKIKILK